jgi:N-sulfoglucosamine sulfohydrolase
VRLLVLYYLLLGIVASGAAEKPNILLIVSEDNGPELGCYGDPYVKTPVLDRLAKDGVRFANSFTPYSVCSPSRACFLTGLDPSINGQLGLATHKFAMYREWPNAFSLLKKAGYHTGLIGKLHVNPESAFKPHIDLRAITSANFGRKSMGAYALKAGAFFTMQDEKPFFLSINYPDAHFPLIPQAGGYPSDEDLLAGKDVKPLPWMGCDSLRLRDETANYYNCMSRLDSLVGDLLKQLEKSGKADNTFILYIGDHGAQFSRGKTSVYDAGLRIPMIVHWPEKVKPAVRTEIVSVTDLLPTILEAVKAKAPANLSGLSLWPLLEGRRVAWREELMAVTTGSAPALGCLQLALRTERVKLIVTPRGQGENRCAVAYLNQHNAHFIAGCKKEEIAAAGPEIRRAYQTYLAPPEFELYDLLSDPYELVNLAGRPEYQLLLEMMLGRLRARQARTGDPLRDPNNIRFWLDQAAAGRRINYRGQKAFRWGYLEQFGPRSIRN